FTNGGTLTLNGPVTGTTPLTISGTGTLALPNANSYGPTTPATVVTLAATGATAGTFVLSFNGQATALINFNDSAATIAAKLQGLTGIGPNGVTTPGGAALLSAAPVVLTFAGSLALAAQNLFNVVSIPTAFVTTPLSVTLTTPGPIATYVNSGTVSIFN